jgi:hypothetical protein
LQNTTTTKTWETKEQIDSEWKAEQAFLIQRKLEKLKREELEALEKRYTLDDLNFSWQMGYESRKNEELEELQR